jgi:predicted LPLAT superfamily acyltransferase
MAEGGSQQWARRAERGALPLIKLMVWLALGLGRPVARLVLHPICLYFLAFSGGTRRASLQYLARALDRAPGLADVFRHYLSFAACVLDRVFFLNDQFHLFDLQVHGEEIVLEMLRRRRGCILLGAHFGSFEAVRALGRKQPDVRISLVMYEENARKIRTVLNAINPDLAVNVIGLGTSDSMLAVGERLEQGDFVGILADRGLEEEGQVRCSFLGAAAAFPDGPIRMAALLQRPVVQMFGVYNGGNRYDVYFETLVDPEKPSPCRGGEHVEAALRLYVARLEHYCRMAPFNWFNFYDFWA